MGNNFPRWFTMEHLNYPPIKGPQYLLNECNRLKIKDGFIQSQLPFLNSPKKSRNTTTYNFNMWNAYQITTKDKRKYYMFLNAPTLTDDNRLSRESKEVCTEEALKILMDASFNSLSDHYFAKYEAQLQESDNDDTTLNESNVLNMEDMKPYSYLKKNFSTSSV